MNRRRILTILAALVVIGAVAGGAFFIWLNTGGTASAPISAPTLEPRTQADDTAEEPAVLEGVDAAAATQEIGGAVPAGEQAASTVNETIFRIDAAQSQVRFSLQETLMGSPVTVVGSTNQVAGDIRVDFANPANSELGIVRVNMRTLATDNSNRNGSIRRFILRTAEDQYEFSDFVPTAISGLPQSVAVGDTIEFQVTGNFSIVDVTQPLTFDVTLTIASETRLEGTASTTILRSNWPPIATFQVPPQVAEVSNEVLLEIDFVALAVEN